MRFQNEEFLKQRDYKSKSFQNKELLKLIFFKQRAFKTKSFQNKELLKLKFY